MASVSSLRRKRSLCYQALQKVKNAMSHTEKVGDKINLSLQINECFLLDNSSADLGNILLVKNKIMLAKEEFHKTAIVLEERIEELTREIEDALDDD
ncbi:MAG: hypothetical protein HFI08_02680 [Bacilli bacterium]|nr:hypothetical protein [Bacilli bacterium]